MSTQTTTRARPAPSMAGTAIARSDQARAIVASVEEQRERLAKLAPKGMEPDHYIASLELYFTNNPKVVECTPASVATSLLRVAETGLRLGVTCDLLPFKNSRTNISEAQFNPRYTGLVELALASGVRAINAGVVREGDHFVHVKGTTLKLEHTRVAPDSAKITHAYAIAEIKAGSFAFEVIPVEHIEKTRAKYSKQWKDGKLEDIEWYAKKTAIRRLAALLPKSPRFAAALAYVKEAEPEIDDAEFTVEPGPEAPAAAAAAPAPTGREPELFGPFEPGQLATEAQIERLLDLIDSPHVNDLAKEKVSNRLEAKTLTAKLAATWIDALQLEVAKHGATVPAAAVDNDELPLT